YFVVFLGSTPIGAPLVGWIAEQFNPRVALALGGVATIASCTYALSRLRPRRLTGHDDGAAPGEEPVPHAASERVL
ncbi:MAG: MFS transporter, partial [Actinomycetota bacterium]|nr:MFS transporter [Actinomycetota bacterium]